MKRQKWDHITKLNAKRRKLKEETYRFVGFDSPAKNPLKTTEKKCAQLEKKVDKLRQKLSKKKNVEK